MTGQGRAWAAQPWSGVGRSPVPEWSAFVGTHGGAGWGSLRSCWSCGVIVGTPTRPAPSSVIWSGPAHLGTWEPVSPSPRGSRTVWILSLAFSLVRPLSLAPPPCTSSLGSLLGLTDLGTKSVSSPWKPFTRTGSGLWGDTGLLECPAPSVLTGRSHLPKLLPLQF